MHYTHCFLFRLLALMLVLATLCLAGCSSPEASGTTDPEITTAPTDSGEPTGPSDPTTPSEPAKNSAHQTLHNYLTTKGDITVEEVAYTFTMRAQGKDILWEYKNDSTAITVTLSDGAATHPVNISFAAYTAYAEVEAATYTSAEHPLINFRCNAPALADSLRNMAATAVWSCCIQAAKAMEPAGADLVSLGFTNYYG